MAERETRISIQFESHLIRTWMREGWISPQAQDEDRLPPRDMARALLIRDLKENFGVNDEGIDLILELVDQIYGLRRCLKRVLDSAPGRPRSKAGKRISARRAGRMATKRILRRKHGRTRTS